MAKVNSTFMDSYGAHVDALFYDVAHRSSGDSRIVPNNGLFFPLARHKSWFDGHSFATGMFSFGNGKSQESSSEAVNCYYGAYLWSLVRHQETSASDLTDYTRLLLAMEIRGAKTYWQMLPPDLKSANHTSSTKTTTTTTTPSRIQVYNAKFESNYMVGNVGMLDVVCNTWFGSDPLYIHMINAIPITAATALLFDKSYVSQEYPYLLGSRPSVEMAWRGYTVSIHAIIDPNAAWETAQGIASNELDSAISKSQVFYWISNRPGFQIQAGSVSSASSSGGETQGLSLHGPSMHK
jgi:endo-1,3(4)-beta-glucanase